MSKSTVEFKRWIPREKSTWPFQVFQKYNDELERMYWSHALGGTFVYKMLGKNKANWTDAVTDHFEFESVHNKKLFNDLKDWSNSSNQFDNWVNLNALIAISSNLETYMASVISLALESDPGVLLKSPRIIDGVSILKNVTGGISFESQIVNCTKGTWQSRSNSYKGIFNKLPEIIENKMGDLDKIRNIRNMVGHAFGRDIEQARQHGVKDIIPMESLSKERTLQYQKLIWSVAKSIDIHLFYTHIGEYQAISFYHKLYPSLNKDVHIGERSIALKKAIGKFGAVSPGKIFCKQLAEYYESI